MTLEEDIKEFELRWEIFCGRHTRDEAIMRALDEKILESRLRRVCRGMDGSILGLVINVLCNPTAA